MNELILLSHFSAAWKILRCRCSALPVELSGQQGAGRYVGSIGSLSNQDDDGNKNPTNLHIWQWKTVFLHALHVQFSSFEDVLVLSKTWNDLFCSCVDDVSIWWQMFNFVFLCPKRYLQFNYTTVRTHFSSITTLNIWKMIAETRSYIFRWSSCFRRRRVCLSSLV